MRSRTAFLFVWVWMVCFAATAFSQDSPAGGSGMPPGIGAGDTGGIGGTTGSRDPSGMGGVENSAGSGGTDQGVPEQVPVEQAVEERAPVVRVSAIPAVHTADD